MHYDDDSHGMMGIRALKLEYKKTEVSVEKYLTFTIFRGLN